MGIEENDLEKLRVFIGPPLLDSYMRYYGMSEEQAKDGIRFYRERFEETGYQECLAYPYVKEILMHLKEHGYRIGLASSKPEEFCVSILEMLEISDYFDVVAGASMDGKIGEKVQVLNEALKRFSIQPEGRFIGKFWDVLIVNLLWFFLSIPIFTIGASTTAMYYVTLKLARDDDGYTIRSFFKSFKENFKQATIIWMIFLITGVVLGFDRR